MTRRLGALGTLIRDRIRHPSREPVEQWGGAMYSLAALSAGCPPGWSVAPLVKVGADVWDDAGRAVDALPNIDRGAGFVRVPEANNRVELRYLDAANRHEILTGGVPPWTYDELRSATAGLSALYLNFISGMEMDLPTAARLRSGFDGPIYADLHSLFLGPPTAGPREPRALPDWQSWLACFDLVQMNEAELALLGFEPSAIGEMLELGPSVVLVTRGSAGAVYAARSSGAVHTVGAAAPGGAAAHRTGSVPPPDGALAGDPTGCGDVWGATLFARLLDGADLVDAIGRAHRAAASKIRSPDIDRLHLVLASSNATPGVLP